MKIVFKPVYMMHSKLVFWLFIISMIVIMLLTLIFVIKELKKK